MGLLRIERRKLDNGGYTSNRYHLTLKSAPIVADNTTPTTDSAPTQMSSRTNNTKDNTKEYTKEFEVFWKHYPRNACM